MGNNSSGRASRSESLEEYCQIFNFTLVKTLGSTLFFKTAKVTFEGEYYVAKFISFTPQIYEAIKKAQGNNNFIERALLTSVNCLPYKAIVKDKVAVLMRPYMYISLLDRMYSNPMLLWIEKKWIIFQMLCAVNLCKRNRIYHGDLKPENIMLSSWNFVFITDFASYKPVYLSETNSTDYTFLFDISNRRICYTAPERFYKSDDVNIFDRFINYDDKGEHSMDIFSLGCIVAELCLDGKPLFDFSRGSVSGKPDYQRVEGIIKGIFDDNVRTMILSMIAENPDDRHTAEYYISHYFPESYYFYLMQIMQEIISASNLTADYIISALNLRWKEITDNLAFYNKTESNERENPVPSDCSYASNMSIDDIGMADQPGTKGNEWTGNPYVILLSLYTSFLSHLKSSEAKYSAFNLFKLFEPFINVSVFFERAIPYMFVFFEDSDPNVVSEAIHIVTDYLSDLPSDCILSHEVFIDFILPMYYNVCIASKRALISLALASKIGDLCQLIYRQLNSVSLIKREIVNLYEAEFDLLCDYLGEMVITLLSKSYSVYSEGEEARESSIGANDIIIQLLRCSIVKIFHFFGEERFRTTLMPHIINIAHKKDSWEVRSEFFRILPDIFLFNHLYDTSSMILSLFDYGLRDWEEFVIYSTILCFDSIFDNDHLETGILLTLIKRVTLFLIYPNTMIRKSIIFFICKIAGHFGPAFTQCCVIPYLDTILIDKVHIVEDIGTLVRNIPAPVSRDLINALLRSEENPQIFFSALEERLKSQELEEQMQLNFISCLSPSIKRVCLKVTLADISCCVKLQQLLCGMHAYRDNFMDTPMTNFANIIKIDEQLIQFPTFNYMDESDKLTKTYPIDLFTFKTPSYAAIKGERAKKQVEKHFPYNYSVNLHQFFNSKREESKLRRLRNASEPTFTHVSEGGLCGVHVASIIYHDAPIHCISTDYSSSLLVSASTNSKYCLWRISDIVEGSCTPLEDVSFPSNGNVKERCFVAHLPSDHNFLAISKSGALHIYDVENGAKINITNSIVKDSGNVVGISVCGNSRANAYAITLSSHGYLSMVDVRAPKPIFLDSISPNHGRSTSFDVNYSSTWLVVGTGSGSCICWDMRFRSPFAVLTPADHIRRSVRSVMINSLEDNEIAASYDSNNCVMLWNVAHGRVSSCLTTNGDIDDIRHNWLSHCVTRMLKYQYNQQSMLLTVGTDMRIRDWNLSNYTQSRVFNMGGHNSAHFGVSYVEKRYPEYTEVIEKNNLLGKNEMLSRKRKIQEFPGHNSIITDAKLVADGNGSKLCITSSFDKTIKIWR